MSLAANHSKTKALALSGILTALSWGLLLLSAYLPTGQLSLRVLAAFLLIIAYEKQGLKQAFLVFVGTSILALLSPGLWPSLAYLLYLGPYILITLVLDRRLKGLAFILVRLLLGSLLCMGVVLLLGKTAFDPRLIEEAGDLFYPAAIAASLLGTAVYDYVLHLLVQEARRRL